MIYIEFPIPLFLQYFQSLNIKLSFVYTNNTIIIMFYVCIFLLLMNISLHLCLLVSIGIVNRIIHHFVSHRYNNINNITALLIQNLKILFHNQSLKRHSFKIRVGGCLGYLGVYNRVYSKVYSWFSFYKTLQ